MLGLVLAISKTLELGSQPNPKHLDLAICPVQGNVDLANMSDPRQLDFSQVQHHMGLTCVPDPRCLDLAIRQVQGHVGLVNMPDPRRLDFAVSQVQGNDHHPLACLGK